MYHPFTVYYSQQLLVTLLLAKYLAFSE